MRITIANNAGEVYVTAHVSDEEIDDVISGMRTPKNLRVTDEEEGEVSLSTLITDAAIWEKANR